VPAPPPAAPPAPAAPRRSTRARQPTATRVRKLTAPAKTERSRRPNHALPVALGGNTDPSTLALPAPPPEARSTSRTLDWQLPLPTERELDSLNVASHTCTGALLFLSDAAMEVEESDGLVDDSQTTFDSDDFFATAARPPAAGRSAAPLGPIVSPLDALALAPRRPLDIDAEPDWMDCLNFD
jgi:hypothetical protein